MVNLGIDFGSTYTTVSVVKDGRPETTPENSRSFSYPSLVAYDEKEQKYNLEFFSIAIFSITLLAKYSFLSKGNPLSISEGLLTNT